ncbi:2OG-Fe(II) oxygenase [Porphyrobacter sp. AAP60]|uniref:2OG-Fe(II) oxygenase n=1 Tax=Porphyrobacter sp. AAP60 TaxID=1523423 RepID=UPI0006B92821|nr:2OG-Fe(II) oxygenase family protein [Porphyrobacter sp. AAP60]KPF61828.1 hypothetical protein IP79_14545 [Porphyrobacter sp. AAP60]
MNDLLPAFLLCEHVREPDRVARLRQEFLQKTNRHVVIDDVFQPQIIDLLQDVVERDGKFVDNLKLSSAAKAGERTRAGMPRGSVDPEAFNSADEADRFIFQRKLDGARPSRDGTPAMKAEALVRRAMGSTSFLNWLSAISGISLERVGGINLKLHGPGNFLRKHSDTRQGRKLCMVHYLHRDWHPDYAGRFRLYMDDGRVELIDPLPNRMILFDVTQDNFHEIEALGEVPPGWVRVNYSVWYG